MRELEMLIRAGAEKDIVGVLDLQGKNLVTYLSELERKNGFVTTPFLEKQLLSLIEMDGLFVIESDGIVLGYAVAAGWDYFKGRPMFDYMIERFEKIPYKGLRILSGNSFQYGPVCIDSTLRGAGGFQLLFRKMREAMSERFEVGATFINKMNERSYQAHTRKAGIDVIDEFDFNGAQYYGLAFLTR